MAKPIECSLLLIVLCFAYVAHGNHHIVRYTRTPSRIISNNGSPSSSSSTSSSSSSSSSSSKDVAAADVEEADSESVIEPAPSSLLSSSSLKSSFGSIGSLGTDKHRGFRSNLGLNSQSWGDQYYDQQPSDMESGDLDRKRQNRMNSGYQDFVNLPSTSNNYFRKRKLSSRQNNPSSNEDGQRINVGNKNSNEVYSSMMSNGNSIMRPFNFRGQNMMVMSVRKCCINGNNCRVLKDGEKCDFSDFFAKIKAQLPNNPMSINTNKKDSDMILSKLMNSNFKPFGRKSFISFGGGMGEDNDSEESENPTDMQLRPMKYSTFNPSVGLGNGMGSYVTMPQRKKTVNYPYSEPMGFGEDEADKIRNQVLQKSNFYREKYNLAPFTLDDKLNNCAQDWANNIANMGTLSHRQDNNNGENLYLSSESDNLGEAAVDAWYNEITKFNIDGDENELSSNSETHHMTQLLWKLSTKLGVGVSKGPNDGIYYVVANYNPPGNLIGSFKKNLPQIKQEDIEQAIESNNSETESGWSSRSISPLKSQRKLFNSYYDY